jgi:SAM-dependent methyltransferase
MQTAQSPKEIDMTTTTHGFGSHGIGLGLARLFLRTLGRRSDGLRLCLEHGLTAGKTVDHVYRNTPSGRGLLGRALDRRFLADPGWEAVRIRRRHLEQLLEEVIEELRDRRRPVSLVDIASGPASYVLSVLERVGMDGLTARCRDLDERWLEEGREQARRLGLSRVVFEAGDAFDAEALRRVRPRVNVVVSSGFYDWITDDSAVLRSMGLAYHALEPGGYLVLTNQTGHPALEFVSAVFEGFDHRPLRMKMRSVRQVREWLQHIGFIVRPALTDERGFYSVTWARKPLSREDS